MDQLVSTTDFDYFPYQLSGLEGKTATFNAFVLKMQEDVLRTVLGNELYDLFDAGLDEDYPADKWVDLRDGADYTIDTIKYKWVGLNKMLVPYVYSEYLAKTFSSHSGIGVTFPKAENSSAVDPSAEISTSSAAFAVLVGAYKTSKNSLYGFLTANYTDYPTWIWDELSIRNRFGI